MKLSHIYILLLALNLAGFPLIAGLATYVGTGSTLFSLTMRSAILGLSVLLIVMAMLGDRIKFVRGVFWLPLLVFWFAYLLRIYLDTSSGMGDLSREPSDYWIWAVGACLVPMLGLLTYPRKDYFASSYKLTFSMLALAALLAAFLGTGWVSPEYGRGYDTGRLRLEALNPISVGHLGLSLLLLSIWPFISAGKISLGYKQLLNIAAGLLGLYLLIAAASRGPLAALILVLFFYFIAQNLKRNWKVLAAIATLLVLVNQVGGYLEEAGSYRPFSRTEAALAGEDLAVSSREISYKGAVNQFLESPIFGDSLEVKETGGYPHNVVLESFMATGLIGGASFLFLVFYNAYISFKILKRKSSHGWISLISLQYLIAAQFSGALYGSTMMWSFLAINIVLYGAKNYGAYNSKRQRLQNAI